MSINGSVNFESIKNIFSCSCDLCKGRFAPEASEDQIPTRLVPRKLPGSLVCSSIPQTVTA